MMEFVLSRVWMVMVGLAFMAVIVAAFAGLDQRMMERSDAEGAEALAGIIRDMGHEEGYVEMEIDLHRTIASPETELTICPGSIWIQKEGIGRAVACSSDIDLFDNGKRVDSLHVARDDRLVIRSSSGQVQLEKVSTM